MPVNLVSFSQITQMDVDSYHPGQLIPSCQLYLTPRKEATDMMYQVKLLGARETFDYFLIERKVMMNGKQIVMIVMGVVALSFISLPTSIRSNLTLCRISWGMPPVTPRTMCYYICMPISLLPKHFHS